MVITDTNSFDFHWLKKIKIQKRRPGNPGSRSQRKYKDIVCAFDIETTTLPDLNQAIMYHWQFAFGKDHVVVGRTWDDLLQFMRTLADTLYSDEYFVVYIHNASYEFQFLKGVYPFDESEVFSMEERKILKFQMFNHFEFRCSALHSDRSLADFCENVGTEYRKVEGFDYKKIRYPWTELSPEELNYCIMDVVCLAEAIEKELENDHDTLYTIPATITGYIRRDVKKTMRLVNHDSIKDIMPDYEVYRLLREAFRGGNCHANRFYADRLLDDVYSVDMKSAYLYAIVCGKYPMSRFLEVSNPDIDILISLMKRNKALLLKIKLADVDLINSKNGNPYISIAKCTRLKKGDKGLFDNGRLIRCEALELTVTDLDLKIILNQYQFSEIEIVKCYMANYGNIPRVLKNTICFCFDEKTQLKNVPGKEVEYYRSKSKADSIYGLMAQNPVRQRIYFDGLKNQKAEQYEEEQLTKYNEKAFLPYQWGIWTTAIVRSMLQRAIDLCGDQFVYCDTDSVFSYGKVDFAELNDEIISRDIAEEAYSTDTFGEVHFMGAFEEKRKADLFKTLGSKKYVCQYGEDIEITVSGVSKKEGGEELREAGGIEHFRHGFTFEHSCGKEIRYNDIENPEEIEIDGHKIIISSNCVLTDTHFTITLGKEYKRFIDIEMGDECFENIFG